MMLSAKLSMVDFVSLPISYPLCRKYNKLSALFWISANNLWMISHNYMIEKTLSIRLLMPRSPHDPFIKLSVNGTPQIYIEHDYIIAEYD